jgi:hypothetical protein
MVKNVHLRTATWSACDASDVDRLLARRVAWSPRAARPVAAVTGPTVSEMGVTADGLDPYMRLALVLSDTSDPAYDETDSAA